MRWIFTSRIEPRDLEGIVSGKYGSTVMFVAFSPVTGWHWIYPGGSERVSEPPMLFLDEQWARAHPRRSTVIHRENPRRIRKKKAEQLNLF
jgi:hypothetical protein